MVSRVHSHAPSIRSHRGIKVVWPDFQPMRVAEEPVCVHLFRQKPVFTSLHLKSPVHGHRLCTPYELFNRIDTKSKCRHLKKLTCKGLWGRCTVYQSYWTGDTVSLVGIFDPVLWSVAPLTFSLVQLSPPPPPLPVWISILYTRIHSRWGGVWGSMPQADKHLPQSPFTVKFF